MNIGYIFEVILVSVFGLFGVLGNALLIINFSKTNKKVNFHKLMITLAVYDTLYILLCFVAFAIPEISNDYKTFGFHHYIAPRAVPLMQVTLTGSVYCTVSISLERYLTVCHPFFVASKKWSAKRHVIPIVAFSVLYNAPHFFEFRTTYGPVDLNGTQELTTSYPTNKFHNLAETESIMSLNKTINSTFDTITQMSMNNDTRNNISRDTEEVVKFEYEVELTSLRKNKYYYTIYIIGLNLLFNGVVPYAIIVVLNILLHNRLKKIVVSSSYPSFSGSIQLSQFQRNSNTQSTCDTQTTRIKFSEIDLAKISIIIAAVFLTFHSVKWIPNIYELIQRIQSDMEEIPWPDWIENVTTVSHFLILLNSSVNYYIYVLTHKKIPQSQRYIRNPRNFELPLKNLHKTTDC